MQSKLTAMALALAFATVTALPAMAFTLKEEPIGAMTNPTADLDAQMGILPDLQSPAAPLRALNLAPAALPGGKGSPQQLEGRAARPDVDPNTLEVGTVLDGLGGGIKSGYKFGLAAPPVPTGSVSQSGSVWTAPPLPTSSGSKSTFFTDSNAGRTSSNPNAGRTSR